MSVQGAFHCSKGLLVFSEEGVNVIVRLHMEECSGIVKECDNLTKKSED